MVDTKSFIDSSDMMKIHINNLKEYKGRNVRSKRDRVLCILIQQRIKTILATKNITKKDLSVELGVNVCLLSQHSSIDCASIIKAIMFLEIDPNTFFRPIMRTMAYYEKNKMLAKIPYNDIDIKDEMFLDI